MNLKTYKGINVKLVEAQARQELGDNAVLLSSFSQGSEVFLTFGWDNSETTEKLDEISSNKPANIEHAEKDSHIDDVYKKNNTEESDDIPDWLSTIENLYHYIEQRQNSEESAEIDAESSAIKQQEAVPPQHTITEHEYENKSDKEVTTANFFQYDKPENTIKTYDTQRTNYHHQFLKLVERQGLPEELIDNMASTIVNADSLEHALFLVLEKHGNFYHALNDLARNDRPTIFVGPPGSGKTITVAKLAYYFKNCCEHDVTIMTTDLLKTGGTEQIVALSKALSISCVILPKSLNSTSRILENWRSSATLIDSTSINVNSDAEYAFLQSLVQATRARVCLVLPSDINAHQGYDSMRKFSKLGAEYLFLSRLDLVTNIGSAIGLICQNYLPILGIANTPVIDKQIFNLNPSFITQVLINQCQI